MIEKWKREEIEIDRRQTDKTFSWLRKKVRKSIINR